MTISSRGARSRPDLARPNGCNLGARAEGMDKLYRSAEPMLSASRALISARRISALPRHPSCRKVSIVPGIAVRPGRRRLYRRRETKAGSNGGNCDLEHWENTRSCASLARYENAEGTGVKTVIVTGGAGFIGSAVLRHPVARGEFRVVHFDKPAHAGNPESSTSLEGRGKAEKRAGKTFRPVAAKLQLLRSRMRRKLPTRAIDSGLLRRVT